MSSFDLQKELARKLIWAVNSTFHTPASAKKRVRAWGWRLAGKMLDAKQPISLTSTPSSRYPRMAGGGADGVLKASSASSLVSGGRDAVPSTPSSEPSTPVRGEDRPTCRWLYPAPAHCSRGDCWWSGPRRFWRTTGCYDGWGRWDWINDPSETPETRVDRRRYADHADDCVRSLEKGCRELHLAAYTSLIERHPWQPWPSTTSQSGTGDQAAV